MENDQTYMLVNDVSDVDYNNSSLCSAIIHVVPVELVYFSCQIKAIKSFEINELYRSIT